MNFYVFWSVDDLKLLMMILGLLAVWMVRTSVKHESNRYSCQENVETFISLNSTGKQVSKQELDKWVS